MDFKNVTVSEFCGELSSSKSVPGGGAASALAMELGICLSEMVAQISMSKTDREHDKKRLRRIIKEYEPSQEQALELLNADARSYLEVAEALKTPKDEPGREEKIAKAEKAAIEVSEKMISMAHETLETMDALIEVCPINLISDIATAAYLVEAGARGAALCIIANAKGAGKDEDYFNELTEAVKKVEVGASVVLNSVKLVLKDQYPEAEGLINEISAYARA